MAAGIATRCQIQLAYAIGVAEPVSIRVDTAETGRYSDDSIRDAIKKVFDLTPQGIIKRLDLRKPVYKATSAYGHFGIVTGDTRTWEQTDAVEALRAAIQ